MEDAKKMIKKVNYFGYELIGSDFGREEICLDLIDVDFLIEKLKIGEKLCEVIPNLSVDEFHQWGRPLEYGEFLQREEIPVGNECFYSSNGFKNMGILLIPEYNVLSRKEIENKLTKTSSICETIELKGALYTYSNADLFYKKGFFWQPLKEGVFVLKNNQLEIPDWFKGYL